MANHNSYPVPGSEPENPVVLTIDQYHTIRDGAPVDEIDIVSNYLLENNSAEYGGVWVQYPERMMTDGEIGKVLWDIACVELSIERYGRRIDEAGVYLAKFDGRPGVEEQIVEGLQILATV